MVRGLVLFFLVSAQLQQAQSRPPADQGRRRVIDRNLETIINLARAAPPEFGADILIRLVEKDVVTDQSLRRELLEQAFMLGAYAQEPSALRMAEGNGPGVVLVNIVFRQGLDAVSLRARVVRAYLRFDARRARALFDLIEPALGPRHTCADQFTVDLSLYYAVMGELLKAIPNQEQRENILVQHLARVRSAAQIAPFIDSLVASRSAVNLTAMTDAFAERLTRLDSDEHAFSWNFSGAVEALGQLATQLPAGSRERLIQQARAWMLQALNHGLCGHRPPFYVRNLDGSQTLMPWHSPEERFNQVLASQSLAKDEISVKDYTMHPVGSRVSSTSFSDDWKRFGAMGQLLAHETQEDKDTTRWQHEMEKYIELITRWTGAENERPRDFYFEKWDLLNKVLEMQKFYLQTPTTIEEATAYWQKQPNAPHAEIPGRDRLMIALAGFLESSAGSAVYNERRIAWFAPVWQMVGSFNRSNRTLGFANLFIGAHDIVLNLYGRFALFTTPVKDQP